MALRFRTAVGLLFGFGSGAVIGVALFDLLPEALDLGVHRSAGNLLEATAIGFASYFVVDRLTGLLTSVQGAYRGHLGAGSLTIHSLMDGLGIGLAFQVSAAVGAVVAFAVLAHDLLDGVNTVTLSLSGNGAPRTARRWLLADAVAPLVGIGVAHLIVVPQSTLAILLAIFAGFFLYIGASELLPRTEQHSGALSNILTTLAGLGLIGVVVRLAGG
jgi:ZIP family zinc transporter